MLDVVILIAAITIAALMFLPGLRQKPVWRAMITPLASIIGSGFLVLGPILSGGFGWAAPLAMGLLCAIALAFGGAIRANIATISSHPEAANGRLEHLSSILLGIAYVISVAYYLNLFGAFALSLTPFDSPLADRAVTTAAYLVILITGLTKGFALLERMEYATVALKLAIIAGLIVGLVHFNASAALDGTLALYPLQRSDLGMLTLLFGLIVTVQGFETTRYLGDEYDAKTRINAMLLATGIASGIYITYILLLTFVFDPALVASNETAVIDMMRVVAPILPLMLVAAALAAQFSASIADTGGAGGLIAELSGGRLTARQSYLVAVALGLALTWAFDVFQIIAYASRAFAAYYAVQALIAARHAGPGARGLWFGALALLALAMALFGEAVE